MGIFLNGSFLVHLVHPRGNQFWLYCGQSILFLTEQLSVYIKEKKKATQNVFVKSPLEWMCKFEKLKKKQKKKKKKKLFLRFVLQ